MEGEILSNRSLKRAIFASVLKATVSLFVTSQLTKSVGLVVAHITDGMALVVWISIHFTFSRLVLNEAEPQGGFEATSSTSPPKTALSLVLSK